MGAFFSSLGRTIIAGFVVLIVIILAVSGMSEGGVRGSDLFVVRWLHVMAGVMWIGLLWYFNFVQIPSMPKIPDDQKPAISKVIAPAALFWFRWSALVTMVLGLLLAYMSHYLMAAMTLTKGFQAIGIGMWLGLIMAFNVWMIIWPNQKKSAWHRDGVPGGKGRGRQDGRHDFAHQYHAVDPDAVLHGCAVARRSVIRI